MPTQNEILEPEAPKARTSELLIRRIQRAQRSNTGKILKQTTTISEGENDA